MVDLPHAEHKNISGSFDIGSSRSLTCIYSKGYILNVNQLDYTRELLKIHYYTLYKHLQSIPLS